MADGSVALRQARKQANLSQREVAKRAGLSLESVRAYEQGRRRPKRSSLVAILDALDVSQADRARIFISAGLAPEESPSFGAGSPSHVYDEYALRQALETLPGPAFAVTDLSELVVANAKLEALLEMDVRKERARRARHQMTPLLLMGEPLIAERLVNRHEILRIMIGLHKAEPHPQSIDEPGDWFGGLLESLGSEDPAFLREVMDLWDETPPQHAAQRLTYQVVWRDPEFGEMRFVGVETASEHGGLYFEDWHPADSLTWQRLDSLSGTRPRRWAG
jgi:transcriptional regulator with XRE-family HTH domain